MKNLGWECPRCHAIHAPFVLECGCEARPIAKASKQDIQTYAPQTTCANCGTSRLVECPGTRDAKGDCCVWAPKQQSF